MAELTPSSLRQFLLEDISESEFKKQIALLNEIFVQRDEQQLKDYFKSPRAVSAYTLLYLPTNFIKLKFLFKQLSIDLKKDFSHARFIDYGTGPGTYLLAFLDFMGESFKGHVIGVDRSDTALRQAQKCVSGFFPGVSAKFTVTSPSSSREKTILFFGHGLNEMGANQVQSIIMTIEPDLVCFIEPGTKQSFTEVKKMRQFFAENDWNVLYPCAHLGACPMAKNREDWCHQVLRTTFDAELERLCQLVKIDRKTQPLIAHAYLRNKIMTPDHFKIRFVRFLQESKYSFNWIVCLDDESELKLIKVEVLKKHLSKKEAKELKKMNVGETVNFEIIKKITPDHWHVKLLRC